MSNTRLETIRYPFYTDEYIQREIKYVASRINEDWENYTQKCGNGHPLYICLLNGAVPFFSDLTKLLEPGYCIYIKASSYGNNQVAGKIDINLSTASIPDDVNRVLIIDDICDSGQTLMAVSDIIRQVINDPSIPIECCTLLNRFSTEPKFNPDYCAIQVNNDYFFAGYGLDDEGLMRNLPHIYVCGMEDK